MNIKAYDVEHAASQTHDQNYLVETVLAERCIRQINQEIKDLSRRGQSSLTTLIQRVFPGFPLVEHEYVIQMIINVFTKGGYQIVRRGHHLMISWPVKKELLLLKHEP